MKKEMSSFDVRSLVTEYSKLEGAHMDKIFQWGSGNALFRINVQGEGKKDIFFRDKKWLYSPKVKPEVPVTPTSFATFMRKYLDNARIGKVRQIGFDRVLEFEVFKADGDYRLIFELFGGGNILLVKDGQIVNCLIQKTWKDRSVRPGEPYKEPNERFNPVIASEHRFEEMFLTSDSDCIRTLATVINLGGQYAEEVCTRSGVPRNKPVSEISPEEFSAMYASLKEVFDCILNDPQPTAYYEDGKIVDVAPIMMMSHAGLEMKRFDTFSEALDEFNSQIEEEAARNYVDPAVRKLRQRIEKQADTLKEYKDKCEELKSKAEALYTEYQKVSELLEVLKVQSTRLTWDRLKAGAMKIPYVKSIDPSKNTVTAEIAGTNVPMDYTKNIDANASDLFQRSKEIGEKAKRAEAALNESREELAKMERNLEKEAIRNAGKAQPTKQFWFERYKWFITSAGKLVIAGRDARTNDNVVKKHLKENDIYVHTDVHGAPSTILKDGQKASEQEILEACIFANSQSKAWIAKLSEGTSFWVYPDQVSKTPNPGEFVPRGAFIIRGKRNYVYHLPIELGVGEISYQGARKVMCAPLDCFKDCTRYMIVRPGTKKGRLSNDMAKRFNVPEEEISRILPPGDVEIVGEVWPKEEEVSE